MDRQPDDTIRPDGRLARRVLDQVYQLNRQTAREANRLREEADRIERNAQRDSTETILEVLDEEGVSIPPGAAIALGSDGDGRFVEVYLPPEKPKKPTKRKDPDEPAPAPTLPN